MKRLLAVFLVLVVPMGIAPAAFADHGADEHSGNMRLLANWDDGGTYREGTDLAFWGNLAVLGKYGGMRLLDVSQAANPRLVGKLDCNGSQNDVSIWDGLAFISVDSPMLHDGCDSPSATPLEYGAGTAWEGVRIIDVSNPAAPRQVGSVYTDCGSHTHTLVPDVGHRDAAGSPDPRVLIYSSSYPLGGQGTPCNAATHRKISVVEIPLNDPSRARVVSTPDVSPAVGCHDITVFVPRKLAVAACITESQLWDISDPTDPVVLSTIRNPSMQIHHSAAVSWDGNVAVLGDEKGGAAAASGCLTGGSAPTGALWFYDISDPTNPKLQGWFVVPQNEVSTMCTAHNFNVIPVRSGKRILTASWYHGGTHVVDFTDPTAPRQVGYYKTKEGVRGTPWSSYWYNGAIYANNFDAGYVPSVPHSRGLDVFAIDDPAVTDARKLPRLNPQTQEAISGLLQGSPVSAAAREKAKATPRQSADSTVVPSDSLPYCLVM